jgi:2'-5' RNA ligase
MPERVTAEIDGIRRGLGVDTGYIPPHVTVVPPVNVADDEVGEALAVLRAAAAATRSPLQLTIGPLDTFLPRNPVVFLRVGGELERLERLHRHCLQGPLHRDERRAYVPHVTVTRRLAPDDDSTLRRLLGNYRVDVTIDRVHLLEQVAGGDRGRHWVPAADVALAPRQVVGRGGLELELCVSEMPDPEVRRLARNHELGGLLGLPGPDAFVAVARRDGIVAGVAWGRCAGWSATLDGVFVAPAERLAGIGGRLLATVEHHLAHEGVSVVEVRGEITPDWRAALAARGWTERPGPGGQRPWRALAPDQPNSMDA